MKKAETFINTFKPFRSEYIYQYDSDLFNQKMWATSKKYLSDKMINEAIIGLSVIGYFITTNTVILGIDLDDHSNKGEAYLLNLYNQVIQRVKVKPSIIFKSPRGLHLYYFFNQFIPTEIITNEAKSKLKGIPCEIRPTADSAIRLPVESKAINPANMQLINLPFENIIPHSKKYHPVELFDSAILPETVRTSLIEKKQSYKAFRAIPKIEAIEGDLMPFENGFTNDSFLKLCNVYRCKGLTVDDALYRFKLCMMQSPAYTGGLTNYKELSRRVKFEYKKNEGYIPPKIDTSPDIFTHLIANNLSEKMKRIHILNNSKSQVHTHIKQPLSGRELSGITKRCNSLKRFVYGLMNWISFHDVILNDKKRLTLWDFMYPYYRKNRKEGLYPIPRSIMLKWNSRYLELKNFLIEVGFLEESEYKYNPSFNICKYYRVNPDRFY